jgi:hypothetical protein
MGSPVTPACRCSTQPSEKFLGRGLLFLFGKPNTQGGPHEAHHRRVTYVYRLSAPVSDAGTGALPHTQVLTGGARGADQLGYRWAWKHQVKHQLFRADWERFGKSAGVRRNHQMAQAGDMLIAFWDGQSPGTAHMVQCMRQLGKPVVVIRTDGQA